MKWWKLGIILSIAYVVLIIGIGIIHTDVILNGKITKEQDAAISNNYGKLCGGGLLVIWILVSRFGKKNDKK